MEILIEENLESRQLLHMAIEKIIEEKLEEKLKQQLEKASENYNSKEWMNIKEACEYMGVSYKSLNNLINQGLKVISIGRSKRLSKTDIDNFLKYEL